MASTPECRDPWCQPLVVVTMSALNCFCWALANWKNNVCKTKKAKISFAVFISYVLCNKKSFTLKLINLQVVENLINNPFYQKSSPFLRPLPESEYKLGRNSMLLSYQFPRLLIPGELSDSDMT